MFVSTSQVILSLDRLKDLHPFFGFAFLAYKKANLPVGSTEEITYNIIKEMVLEPYFKPIRSFPGYFTPFHSNKKWVSARYDSTSLQRIIADTFSDAFIYEKGSGRRGWSEDYVPTLRRLMVNLKSSPIPLLDLAVWLYRDHERIPNEADAVGYLVGKIIDEFRLTKTEQDALCLVQRSRAVSLAPEAPDLNEVWNVLGWPEGYRDEGGVALEHLALLDVGPARELSYSPRNRLNIVTGDNSLGKTFLLDCVWWACSGAWYRHEAEPRRASGSKRSEISYTLNGSSGRSISAQATYNRLDEAWQRPIDHHEGIGVYATHSGGFALWDPVRSPHESSISSSWITHLVLSREQAWEGLKRLDAKGRPIQICNGLIHDWVSWQASDKRYGHILRAFERCMRELSPPEGPTLRTGGLARIAGDSRDFPTIKMPYGDVPIVYASAGVQRILALAYVLVWHWNEHVTKCERARRAPFNRMLVIIDEVEAHLHPRWQRQILPALLATLRTVAPQVEFQVHVSTHSPLVLASIEPEIENENDGIHHLSLRDDEVTIQELDIVKHGTADAWLESDIFGLGSARSLGAERAIARAKELQIAARPSRRAILEAHRELLKVLPDDDAFWVRWLYFAQKSGAIESPGR